MIILYHILINLIGLVDGCVRTADIGTTTVAPTVTTTVAGITTTTTVGVTTTTTVATTTAAACGTCTAGQVALGPDPNDGDLSHAPTSMAGPTQNGCVTLIITCTPLAGNAESLMTFQDGLGGPPPGNPATATLVCNSMGQFQLEDFNGPPVTEAHCFG